jgi:16S rRNA (guanine527-N7)-methyltransferase
MRGAHELGIPLSVEQINSVFVYLVELKKWNNRINLTAIREERDILIKHVLDSLSYLKGFHPTPGMRLMDMGSGAGFPALPIKIVHPEIAITMVESVKKKASFLRHVVRTLGTEQSEIVDKRIESLPFSERSTFDIVTARAFAEMTVSLRTGWPFLKPGGLMILSRGPGETIGEQALSEVGAALDKKVELVLPFSDYRRVVWALRKTAS